MTTQDLTRERYIEEVVNKLKNITNDIILVMVFNNVMKTKDIPLIMACHASVGRRVVDAVMASHNEPMGAVAEYLDNGLLENDIDYVVELGVRGYEPSPYAHEQS